MGLFDTLGKQIESNGKTEEKQLLGRWSAELSSFLGALDKPLGRGMVRLELGLEAGPVLKLAAKHAKLSPVTAVLAQKDSLSGVLPAVAAALVDGGQRFHFGIRTDPRRCHREIYAPEQNGQLAALARQLGPVPGMPDDLKVSGWGFDELQGVSAYFASYDNPSLSTRRQHTVEKLEDLLKVSVRSYEWVYGEHYRLQDGTWSAAKHLVELKNFGPALAARMVSSLRPSYFSYLAPTSRITSAVLGLDESLALKGIYFTA